MTPPILITGATGFIGGYLTRVLTERGVNIRSVVRTLSDTIPNPVIVGNIDDQTDWMDMLKGVETVIHLAGRVHILKEITGDPLSEFRRVNAHGTLRLAEQMVDQGCRRLVFVSTIFVNGESTPIDVSIPEILFRLPLRVIKQEHIADKLFGSWVVDSRKTRQMVDRESPMTVSQGLMTLRGGLSG